MPLLRPGFRHRTSAVRNRSTAVPAILHALAIALGVIASCKSKSPIEPPPQSRCGETGIICTIAGTGRAEYNGEARLANETSLYLPLDIDFDLQGRLHILDWNNQRIRRLDADGRVRTIMGTGFEGDIVEGAPALSTPLHHAFALAFDAAGNMYVAGNHVSQILQVDTGGLVHIVAGTDTLGFDGDGRSARLAKMTHPCGVAVAPGGSPLFIADTGNNRIRIVDASGNINTLAGTGTPGYSGDGGPAELAQLDNPYRVRFDAATGDLYVCDTNNDVVRRIDSNHTITTVAGTGQAGYSGDGDLARNAQLEQPYDVAIGPGGVLYIADTGNDCIRKVDANGIITTIAGNGVQAYSGDGKSAAAAQLGHPSGIRIDAQGNIWISDFSNHRVREIWR